MRCSAECWRPIKQVLRTIHHHSRIIYETMDHAQRLCDSDLGLILGQSIQSLEYSFNFALSQYFLCKLLYGTLRDR